MKNKLLITTAIVGLTLAGNAYAVPDNQGNKLVYDNTHAIDKGDDWKDHNTIDRAVEIRGNVNLNADREAIDTFINLLRDKDTTANLSGSSNLTLLGTAKLQSNGAAMVNLGSRLSKALTLDGNSEILLNGKGGGTTLTATNLKMEGNSKIYLSDSSVTSPGELWNIVASNLEFNGNHSIDAYQDDAELIIKYSKNDYGTIINNGTLELNTKLKITDTSGNTDTIVNKGTINLNKNTLTGNVDMSQGGTLNIALGKVSGDKLESGQVDGQITGVADKNSATKANINFVLSNDYVAGNTAQKIAFTTTNVLNNVFVNGNILYQFSSDAAGKNVVTNLEGLQEVYFVKKTQEGVVSDLLQAGITNNEAVTIAAFAIKDGVNELSNSIGAKMSELVQSGNAKEAGAIANQVAPETAPILQSQLVETVNHVFNAISHRFSTTYVSSLDDGASSGDSIFERGAAWVQSFIGKSKLDNNDGFENETTGVAMGVEKELECYRKIGLGYAYTNNEIESFGRKNDVDTHTAFIYGEYKPYDWYINGIASYSWSQYDESKYAGASSSYDVNSFALQVMTGIDHMIKGTVVTPEAGLRYISAKRDAYTDSIGQRIDSENMDVLTAIVATKVQRDYVLDNGTILRPSARLAMTYDISSDDSSANVLVSNGSTYMVEGEALDEFGVEAGAGVTAAINDNWEMSLGYEGKFRKDYYDHSGLLNATYKF